MIPHFRIVSLAGLLASIIAIGTLFFRWAEGWSWLDAYFFSVVTLSTVGYGNLVPITAAGKIGTTVFIFLGLGVFALVIQQIGAAAMQRQERNKARRSQSVSTQHLPPSDGSDAGA